MRSRYVSPRRISAGGVLFAVGFSIVSFGASRGGIRFSRRCLMVSPTEGCALTDVNRDGKLDIVAGPCWFAGPDFVPRPLRDIPEVSLGFGRKEFYADNGDHVWDVDGDGWVDVISGGWTEPELCWWRNPGREALLRGLKWQRHVLFVGRKDNEAYDVRDLDGDGVPEVVIHTWVQRDPLVALRLRTTEGGTVRGVPVLLGEGCGHGYAVGDVNGDGLEDILCGAGWHERPRGDIFSKKWKLHRETALRGASSPFVVADVNGDGRNDLLWGRGHNYGLYWWEQGPPKANGTTTWKEHLIDKSWSQAHSLLWADLDGDGQGELIAGKRVRGHGGRDPGANEPPALYYYRWEKAAGRFRRFTISPPGAGVGTGMQIRVADLNGDNRKDIAVAGKTGTWVLLNEGPVR